MLKKVSGRAFLALLTLSWLHVTESQQEPHVVNTTSNTSVVWTIDVVCIAELVRSLLGTEPCQVAANEWARPATQIASLYNATNEGLKNCGRDLRIRVSNTKQVGHSPSLFMR